MKKTLLLIAILYAGSIFAQEERYNYVKSTIVTSESSALVEYSFADGLGRPCQTVKVGCSPKGKDLVDCLEYDTKGQVVRTWLPISVESATTPLHLDVFASEARKQHMDLSPFQSFTYEASPLNRKIRTFGTGNAWRSANSSVRTEYLANGIGEILSLSVNKNILTAIYYAPGALEKVCTFDENGKLSEIKFIDMFGNVVCIERGNGKTYYVYDNMGNLRCIIPPPLSASLTSRVTYDMSLSPDFMRCAFFYEYDARNRCVLKRLPGCEPVEMTYDKADRMIFQQNGNQRKLGRCSFFLYDKYGRERIIGQCSKANLPNLDNKVVIVPGENSTYSDNLALADVEELKVNYYDDYNFLNNADAHLTFVKREGYDIDITHSDSIFTTSGLLTGCYVKVLDDSGEYLKSAFYYDSKGRLIQKRSNNMLGGFDFDYYALNYYTGAPLRKYTEHLLADSILFTELFEYSYDHAGRLISTYHTLNSGERTLLSENTYDEFGHLTNVVEGNTPSLSTTYDYNIRGWITSMDNAVCTQKLYYNEKRDASKSVSQWNGNLSSYTWNTKSYDYSYDANDWLKAAYSSEIIDGETSEGLHDVFYSYDSVGNILSIQRNGVNVDTGEVGQRDDVELEYDGNQVKNVSNQGYKDSSFDMQVATNNGQSGNTMEYDANGNVVKDSNKGITLIKYNVLNLPEEIHSDWMDCRYTYDADGNKLASYYVSKLLVGVPSSQVMEKKQSLRITPSKWMIDYVYVDDYVCKNNNLGNEVSPVRLSLPKGYVSNPGSSNQSYNFFVKDHLGNNRLVVDGKGKVVQTNNYYPFGGLYGDSKNESSQEWRFGGKELDRNFDLYDFLARWYDPTLGRFTSIDPMAEKYPWLSPYVYCANNPIKFVDMDGKRPSAYEAALMALYVYRDKSDSQDALKILLDNGWRLSSFNTTIQMDYTGAIENGLQSNLFERKVGNKIEYAYAYAGTNSITDAVEDLAQIIGLSLQYYTAINNAETLSKEIGKNELTFVGHSLGGGEAAAASMATNRTAITFNPASVSKITKILYNFTNENNITNYRTIGVRHGTLIFGGDPVNNLQDNLYMSAPGKTISIPIGIANPLASHSIKTIVDYFKKYKKQ